MKNENYSKYLEARAESKAGNHENKFLIPKI